MLGFDIILLQLRVNKTRTATIPAKNNYPKTGFSYFKKMFSAPADIAPDPMMGNVVVLEIAKRLKRKSI
jgi:hypothetical protein